MGSKRYIIKDREQSSIAEAYRVLRASILGFQRERPLKTILFTSASEDEGKSVAAVNTAASLAYAGYRVILVDADLRNPAIKDILALKNVGLTNIIYEGQELGSVIQASKISNLNVIASGPSTERAPETLASPKMAELIATLRENADYVIIDSPSLVTVADACILASKVDGVILTLAAEQVLVKTGKKVMELLEGAKAKMVGAVLTNVEVDKDLIYYGSD